ncbi:MAG: lysophospholipid acyltransferase family protein [Methylophilaceae bacterium]
MKTFKILLHILLVVPLCLLILVSTKNQQERIIRFWCKRLLSIFEIKVEVTGLGTYLMNQKKYLMVANHISWMDIIVIQSIKPCIFVAKSDVASWPLFGWVAQMTGTIFIKRDKVSDIKKALKKMKRRLIKRSVCIFPEGTSTNGRYLLPFKSNLFQSSIDTNKSILPLCLRYEQNNTYSDKAAFVDDMSLVDSINKIKQEKDIYVIVEVLQPIRPRYNRKELASYTQEMIRKNLSQNLS